MQRFTRFTFSTHVVPKLSVLVICSRLSAPQLFKHWVVHFKIAPKVSLQLRSWLVPRPFLGFSPVVAAQQVMGRTKHSFSRGVFHFALAFLKPLMILASCLQSKTSRSALVRGRFRRERVTRGEERSKSAILPPFRIKQRKFSVRKDRKTWLWLAGSNQNATNTTNQIPRLSSVRVRQTNNGCAQAYVSLCSPFSILGPSSFPLESFFGLP